MQNHEHHNVPSTAPGARRETTESPHSADLFHLRWPKRPLPPFLGWFLTAALVLVTFAGHTWVHPHHGEELVILIFFLPITIAALLGGLRSGLFATALTAVGTLLVIYPPLFRVTIVNRADRIEWWTLIGFGVIVSILGEFQRQSRQRWRAAHAHLSQTSAALDESESRLRLALAASHMSVWECSLADQRITFPGDTLSWGHEFPREGLLADYLKFIHVDDVVRVREAAEAALYHKNYIAVEFRVQFSDGGTRWASVRGKADRGADGKPSRILGTVIDITEQRVAEESLRVVHREMADMRKALNEHAILAVTDARGRIIEANEKFCEISQYSREELIGRDHRILNSGYHSKEFFATLWRTIKQGKVWHGDIKNRARDGTYYWVAATIVPMLDNEGLPQRFITIRADITERKRSEELRSRFTALVQSSSDAIIGKTLTGIIHSWNPSAERIFGYTAAEAIGMPMLQLIPKDRIHEEDLILARIACGEQVEHFETVRQRKDGSLVHISASISPVYDASGQIVGASKIARDITERKRFEAALIESETHLATIIDNLAEGLLVADSDGNLLRWNRAGAEMHGFENIPAANLTLTQLRSVFRLSTPEGAPLPMDQWPLSRVLAGEVLRNYEVLARQTVLGWERIYSYNGAKVTTKDGKGIAFISLTDITARKKAEKDSALFRSLVDHSTDAFEVIDPATGRFLDVNARDCAELGYTREEMLAMRLPEIAPSLDGYSWDDISSKIMAARQARTEGEHRRKDGSTFPVEVNLQVVTLDRDYFVAVVRNNTERNDAAERLRFQEAILRETGHIAKVGGWSFEVATGQGYWTEEVALIHDLPPGSKITKEMGLSFYTPESRARIEEAVRLACTEGISYDLELEIISAKNVRKWVRTIGHPVVEKNTVVRVRGSFQDITERKSAEAALSASEGRFRQMAESLPQLIWTCKPTGECDYLSPQWVNYTGQAEQPQLGYGWLAHVHPDDRAPLEQAWKETTTALRILAIEFRIRRHDGVYRWFDTRAVPVLAPDGRPVKWVGSNTDIEDQKQAHAEQERLTNLIELSSDFVAIADLQGKLTYLNEGGRRMIGLKTDDDACRLTMTDYVADHHKRIEVDTILSSAARVGIWEGEMQLKNLRTGAPIDVFRSTFLMRDPQTGAPWCYATVSRDVTTTNQTVRRLAALAEVSRILVEANSLAEASAPLVNAICRSEHWPIGSVWAVDPEAGVLRHAGHWRESDPRLDPYTERTRAITFKPGEGLPGIVWATAQTQHMPNAITDPRYLRADEGRMAGLRHAIAFPFRRDGEIVGVVDFLTANEVELDERLAKMFEIIGGQVGLFIQRRRAEDEARQLNISLEERIQERTEQLRAANSELEAFSYSVSHDLRSPLRAIDGFAQALQEDHGPQLPEEGQHYLQVIRQGTTRMADLIDDLLSFSRLSRQTLVHGEVDMNMLVRASLAEMTPHTRGREVTLEIGDLPPASGDLALLKQVWINLLSNAYKYTAKRTPAQITVGVVPDATPTVYFVRDNGTGFDMRYAEKLFGVFQRLHRMEDYEGTGVGLAIVKRVIARHGGKVWAEAKPDHGATFYFTLNPENHE